VNEVSVMHEQMECVDTLPVKSKTLI